VKNKSYFLKIFAVLVIGLLSTLPSVGFGQQFDTNYLGGLVFSGNHKFPISPYKTKDGDKLKEKTKLLLTNEKQINLKGNYSISFKTAFWYNFSHGSIFRISNKHYSIKFLFDHHPDSSNINLSLAFNNESTPVTFRFKRSEIYDGKWFECQFDIDEFKGIIKGKINGVSKEFKTKSFYWQEGSDIAFGAEGITKDCAPMILKDLGISIDGKLEHHYLFTEMEGNTAYDSEGNLDALVTNHEWLINQHYFPHEKDSFYVNSTAILAFSLHKTQNELIIKLADTIKIYDLSFHTFSYIPINPILNNNLPVESFLNTENWDSSSFVKEDKRNKLRYFLHKYGGKDSTLIKISFVRIPTLTAPQYNDFYENSPTRIHQRNKTIIQWSFTGFGIMILLFFGYFGKLTMKRRREFWAKEREDFERQIIIKDYPKTNYLSIFGKFKIVDKDGVNHAEKLSPKLEELLAMIVFYNVTDKNSQTKGVNFKLLQEIFWYNIKSENIKNNRNVAFARIRKVLEEFNGLTLSVRKNEVSLDCSREISNKVEEYLKLVDFLNLPETSQDETAFASFAGIVSEGVALNDLHSEWAESTRSILRSKVIHFLGKYIDILFKKSDYKSCIKIADIAFIHDPLHEITLKYKIRAHVLLGEIAMAEECYNLFCKQYLTVYHEEFPFEYEELLED